MSPGASVTVPAISLSLFTQDEKGLFSDDFNEKGYLQ